MRLEAVVFVVAVASAAAAAAEELSNTSVEVLGDSSRSIIKDILEKLIKEIEGEKKEYLEKIEITKNARFENISVESFVDKITLNIADSLPTIEVKSLKVPVNRFRAKGVYIFDDFTLPGGLTIYGNGEFTILLDELELGFLLKMRYKSVTGKWTVQDLGVEASLKNCLVEFENLMNGEPMGDFIHKMINQFIPVLVDLAQGLVQENKEPIMQFITQLINDYFREGGKGPHENLAEAAGSPPMDYFVVVKPFLHGDRTEGSVF